MTVWTICIADRLDYCKYDDHVDCAYYIYFIVITVDTTKDTTNANEPFATELYSENRGIIQMKNEPAGHK